MDRFGLVGGRMNQNPVVELQISPALRVKLPDLVLGVLRCRARVSRHDPSLWAELEARALRLRPEHSLEAISEVAPIRAARAAYRSLGKDPNRYRGSAEALLRRVLQGKSLYRINTVVDVNTLISLESLRPVGCYDLGRLRPPLAFRAGVAGEYYKGIGKEIVSIAELPVFADADGPFGSSTSDSERSMIREETEDILMVIISFAGEAGLPEHLLRAAALLRRHAGACDIATGMVRP